MSDAITFSGVQYVSANDASLQSGLSAAYIALLSRQGKVRAKKAGQKWYVDPLSLHCFLTEQAAREKERLAELSASLRAVAGREQHGVQPSDVRASASATNALTLPPPQLIAHVRQKQSADRRAKIFDYGVLCLSLVLIVAANLAVFDPAFAEKMRDDIASASAIAHDAPAILSALQSAPSGNASALSASAATGAAGFLRTLASWLDPLGAVSPSLTHVRASPTPTNSSPTSAAPATTTIVYQTITEPVVERVVQALPVPTPEPLSNAAFVTQSQYQSGLSALGSSLRELIASDTFNAAASPPPGGGGSNTIAAANAIDQLSGTTLSNVTVNGVSGLTASEIPALNYEFPSGKDWRGVVVAQENTRVVGLALVTSSFTSAVPYGVIEDLVIDDRDRDQGCGETMMSWIVDQFRHAGNRRVFLESGTANERAHRFFQRAGFRQVSIVMMAELTEI